MPHLRQTHDEVVNHLLWYHRPDKMIWHGSTSEGRQQVAGFCEAWRVGDQGQTGMASSLQSGSLLQQTSSSCASSYVVLCIENSYIGHARR